MKKILILLFVLASLVSKAQFQTPISYHTPIEFGGAGDSTTDNTAAFRALAAACAANGWTFYIPPGNWVIKDSVIILAKVKVIGAGGNAMNNDLVNTHGGPVAFSVTNILMQANNKSGFVVAPADTNSLSYQTSGVGFEHFNLVYQGTTPTNNAGIRMVDGGAYYMNGVSIDGFYDDLDVKSSSYASIIACNFTRFAHSGMQIQNTLSQDFGGTMIVNTTFVTGKYNNALAGLHWSGSGALRMSNSEFNLGDLIIAHQSQYNILMDTASNGQSTQEIYFTNISFSAFDSAALMANNLANGTKDVILDDITVYGPIDSLNQAAIQIGTKKVGGTVTHVYVAHLTATGYAAPLVASPPIPVCIFTRCANLYTDDIDAGTYYNGGAAQYVSCQNTFDNYKMPISTSDVDGSGNPIIGHFVHSGSLTIETGLGTGVSYPNQSLTFKDGISTTGFVDQQHRWGFGATSPVAISGWSAVTTIKDSNSIVGVMLRNNSNGANAHARDYVYNGTNYGFLGESGTAATTTLGIPANATAVYSNSALYLIADGVSSSNFFLNHNGGGLEVTSGNFVGVDLAVGAAGAILDILGTTAAWNSFRIRNGVQPTSGQDGSIYNSSADHHLRFYDGTAAAWQQLDRQTLDLVTTAGATTANNITVGNVSGSTIAAGVTISGNGFLQVKAGNQTTTIAKGGGNVFDHFADAATGANTTETDLYSDNTTGAMLTNNGDVFDVEYSGILSNNATTKTLRAYFGGTVVGNSGAITVTAAGTFFIKMHCIRVSSTVVRCSGNILVTGPATALDLPFYTEVTGLTLTSAQIIKLTGQNGAGGAANDIVAKTGIVKWLSAP